MHIRYIAASKNERAPSKVRSPS